MNKKFKMFISFYFIIISILFSTSIINVSITSKNIKSNPNEIHELRVEDYNSFISPYNSADGSSQLMYFGRVLKYYFANRITINDDDLTTLKTIQITDGTSPEEAKFLFIQNVLASTINISIYGSSSDGEFFAETFTKWLNTPDEIKNKSWEITNDFFIDVFPKILKYGGSILNPITLESDETMSLQNYIVSVIEETTPSSNNYDFSKAEIDSTNKVDLNYSFDLSLLTSSYYGVNESGFSSSGALSSIASQIVNAYNITSKIGINSETWFELFTRSLNDSYTKASNSSIQKFNNFNSNHFTSFDQLNAVLSEWTKDKNGISLIDFSRTYNKIEEEYLSQTPILFTDSEKWTKEDTTNIKNITLFLFNMVYSLLNNETWLKNILTGFVVSPDYPLKSSTENLNGVMGLTSNWIYNGYKSTSYATILLTGVSLTFKEYNSDYTKAFWSSPMKYSVLIHEFGHALDGFGSKINNYRNKNYSSDLDFYEIYEGNYFEEYESPNDFSTKNTIIIASVAAGVTLMVIVIIIITVRGNKIKNKN